MKVVICAGTHGNERTGIWLLNKWQRHPELLPSGHQYKFLLANPRATAANVRFVDSDLNRSFGPGGELATGYEAARSKEVRGDLVNWAQGEPYFLIDLHTTTTNMGATLVLSKNDYLSAHAVAKATEDMPSIRLLFNSDQDSDCRFVDSLAPHGVLVEMGPVAQGVEFSPIIDEMERVVLLLLEKLLLPVSGSKIELSGYLEHETVFYPTQKEEKTARIHPSLWGQDYKELKKGDPLFLNYEGQTIFYEGESCFPVFIGESAYYWQNIAFLKSKPIRRSYLP
ncbi:MAG: aspartoacylase [Pseudobdellovibrionaceae bacterium]|nr:MAG: aspartoacylase [Pseudobdellovibrionaceae bacterium]